MNLLELIHSNNEIELIDLLKERGIFKKTPPTCKCGTVASNWKDRSVGDAKWWRCPKTGCNKWITCRYDSIFYGSKLSLKELLLMMYYWGIKSLTQTVQEEMIGVSRQTICSYHQKFRLWAVNELDRSNVRLGGNGMVVEIDESLFVKVKHHKGKDLTRPQVWVFGLYERDESRDKKRCLFIVVPKRDAYTLLNIIYHYVLPKTIIHSDCWAAYNRIKQLDKRFTHLTVNHDLHFVDPQTLVHTNSIESMWRQVKLGIDKSRGVNRQYLQSYLDEFAWRHNNQVGQTGALDKLLDVIAANQAKGAELTDLAGQMDQINLNKEEEFFDLDLDQDELDSSQISLNDYSPDNEPEQDLLSECIPEPLDECVPETLAESEPAEADELPIDESSFKTSVAQKLGVFQVSDDKRIEFKGLTCEQREIVHGIASRMALNHVSKGEEPDRILFVYKPGVIIGTPKKRKVTREILKLKSNTPIPKAKQVDKVIAKPIEKDAPKKRDKPKKTQQQQPQDEAPQTSEEGQPRYNLRSRNK